MAPGLKSEFKHFSFPTPPSSLTFKVKSNMKRKRCIWTEKGLLTSATRSSRPRIGQKSSGRVKFQEWLTPGNDLRWSQHFFPSGRILGEKNPKKPEKTHKTKNNSRANYKWSLTWSLPSLYHPVIQVRGHLPQVLTTVLLSLRSKLLPDAIHWSATSCLYEVRHRCSYKDGQNINAWKNFRWYWCPSVLRHNFLLRTFCSISIMSCCLLQSTHRHSNLNNPCTSLHLRWRKSL